MPRTKACIMNSTTIGLDRLRSTIDSIDDRILDLVEQRFAAARAVAAAKDGGNLLKLCPRREAEVIGRLEARSAGGAAAAVRHIWRELMAHSLQLQARTDLILAAADGALDAAVREAFGSAPRLLRVQTAAEALRAAAEREAIAILPLPLPVLPAGLREFRTICDGAGEPIAAAIGRVAGGEVPAAAQHWSPASWRACKASQMPIYADAAALAEVEAQLSEAPPVARFQEAAELKQALARAAQGNAFLVQAGDCAESFDGFSADQVGRNNDLLLALGRLLPIEAVHVARAAGQFGKPRSASIEESDEGPIPTYRGDAVNGAERSRAARNPDPQRLLRAHAQSAATAKLLDAYASAAALTRGSGSRVYASHEALLLNYEQGLTRWDEQRGCWWATSGHMLWIGDRTRNLDGAHVEYARGIANPIGLKCGLGLGPDELLRLIDRLDPRNEAGRLVLIGRFGAGEIGRALPPLMKATRAEGRNVLWVTDPMHGNGRIEGGVKTRLVEDILTEMRHFFAIAGAVGVHPGGVHLEAVAAAVTECLSGPAAMHSAPLWPRYESPCDPRLNAEQSREVGSEVAISLRRHLAQLVRAA
jgi:3-deoxy-7-phosphoheptulonate synthase